MSKKSNNVHDQIIDSIIRLEDGYRLISVKALKRHRHSWRNASPLKAGPSVQGLMPPSQKKQFPPGSNFHYFAVISIEARRELDGLAVAIKRLQMGGAKVSSESIEELAVHSLCVLKKAKATKVFSYEKFVLSLLADIKLLIKNWIIVVPVRGVSFDGTNEFSIGKGKFVRPGNSTRILSAMIGNSQAVNKGYKKSVLQHVRAELKADAYFVTEIVGDVVGGAEQAAIYAQTVIDVLHYSLIRNGLSNRQIMGVMDAKRSGYSETYFAIDVSNACWSYRDRIKEHPFPFVFNKNVVDLVSELRLMELLKVADLDKKNKGHANQLLLGVKWLGRAYRASDPIDQLLFSTIALELVLVPDGKSGEIAEKFSLRVAVLLGKSAEERMQLRELAKCIYKKRCQIAHAGGHRVDKTIASSGIIVDAVSGRSSGNRFC